MTTNARSPHSEIAPDIAPDITVGMTSSGRVFQSFRRWPLVPTRDLVWLRSAIERSASADDSRAAQELLRLVDI